MRHNDMVIVTPGPHKDRSAVRVYDLSVGFYHNDVNLHNGCGVRVGRRDVRFPKRKYTDDRK